MCLFMFIQSSWSGSSSFGASPPSFGGSFSLNQSQMETLEEEILHKFCNFSFTSIKIITLKYEFWFFVRNQYSKQTGDKGERGGPIHHACDGIGSVHASVNLYLGAGCRRHRRLCRAGSPHR